MRCEQNMTTVTKMLTGREEILMYEKYTKSRLFFMLLFGIGLMLLLYQVCRPDRIIQTKEKYEQAFHIEKNIVTSTSEVPKLKPHVLEKDENAFLSADEYAILCRIVQAEAGGEDATGKQMVAEVIINRVNSPKFPNTIAGVVFQSSGGQYQFSPVGDGRYNSVSISGQTKEAVMAALQDDDVTNGALYFVAAGKTTPEKRGWFENKLTFLTEHGGHRFYK